ncbi:MAG: twin-arginine translocation signal domain-containing protein, partial [Armatimonadota bacterium]|nr:twin-arginine translocation signal domain-containing protein [Armatimonadota bacterium]
MKRSDTSRMLTRRHFLKGAAAITALSGAVPLLASALSGQAPSPEAAESRNRNKPPRRCGFNLHNMHSTKGLGVR